MKILIVNAFGKARDSEDRFAAFVASIKKIFAQHQGLSYEFNFALRHKDELDDYLYDPHTTHNKKEAIKVTPLSC